MNLSIKTQTPAGFSSGWVKVLDLLWHHHQIDALDFDCTLLLHKVSY